MYFMMISYASRPRASKGPKACQQEYPRWACRQPLLYLVLSDAETADDFPSFAPVASHRPVAI
jgi:hypothetical protein